MDKILLVLDQNIIQGFIIQGHVVVQDFVHQPKEAAGLSLQSEYQECGPHRMSLRRATFAQCTIPKFRTVFGNNLHCMVEPRLQISTRGTNMYQLGT